MIHDGLFARYVPTKAELQRDGHVAGGGLVQRTGPTERSDCHKARNPLAHVEARDSFLLGAHAPECPLGHGFP